MEVNGVTTANPTIGGISTRANDELGKNDFLKLLLAQLRNQDPLKPMEDREFITQMAQLNSLEQLQALNERIGELIGTDLIGRASELIGKRVEAIDLTGSPISGVVDSVRFKDGMPWLRIGNQDVRYDDLTAVGGTPA